MVGWGQRKRVKKWKAKKDRKGERVSTAVYFPPI
jgi:hypothetical protein